MFNRQKSYGGLPVANFNGIDKNIVDTIVRNWRSGL
jgi:hypothetical protein